MNTVSTILTPSNQELQNPISGLVICLLSLLAIIFSVILRTEPQIMTNEVLNVLHVTPEGLSEVSLQFQYYLIGALLIAGLVTDVIGARLTLVVGLIAAMVGNWLFSTAIISDPSIMWGRIIISFAHPLILISALTLGAHWLPRRHFSVFVGTVFAALLVMPEIAKSLFSNLVSVKNLWFVMLGTNIFAGTIILFLIITAFSYSRELILENTLDEILAAMRYSKLWGICLVSLIGWLPNTFLLNYGESYLISVAHFNSFGAAQTVAVAFTCFAFGAVIMGIFADFCMEKCWFIMLGYLAAAGCFSVVLSMPHLSTILIAGLLFLTGFFCGAATICYAKAYDLVSPSSAGIAFGMMAAITTLGNNFGGKGLGMLLEHYIKTPATAPVITWQIILSMVPLLLFFGALLAWNLRFKPIQIK